MAGGWSPQMVDRAKQTSLPEQIKCSGCQKIQSQSEYSETQVTKLRNKVAVQGNVALSRHLIRCQSCTGGTVPTTIKCSRCRRAKPLEAYTKVQRKNTELATCKTCASELMMSKQWHEENEHFGEGQKGDWLNGPVSSIVESDPGGVNLQDKNQSNTFSSPSGPSLLDIEDNESVAGGVWLEPRSRTARTNVRSSLAADSGPSSASYSGWNIASFGQMENGPNSESAAQKARKNPWAKVKSHDPYRNARIMELSDPTGSQSYGEESNESAQTLIGTTDASRLHKTIKRETKERLQGSE